ncbi:MAG: ATP-binding protein [Chloroflexota bacterium]
MLQAVNSMLICSLKAFVPASSLFTTGEGSLRACLTAFVSQSYILFLILLVALVIICGLVVFFSLKLKKVNRELYDSNQRILKINQDLKKSNSFLEAQKETLSRVHSETDKFHGMLLQSADDGISFYDSSWNLKYANSAFYSMIGLDYSGYNSLDQNELIHPDDRDYSENRIKSLTEKGFFESELRLLHRDGHYLHLSTRSVTVKNDDGQILGSLTISRDISKLKQAHADLIKANTEAEASNRLKSSFLANISHEIRTPLNSVVGFSNLLLSDDITKEVREEYVEHINFNSEKLLQIIGDIIDLSRLESSQIEIRYEETSLNSIIDEIAAETRGIIKRNEKPIVLNVRNNFRDRSDLIFTDRVWLKRVLNHLMDNAVKFTLDGSIELICTLEEEKILFSIKDTGVGINKENLSRIFEEFRQEIGGHHRPFEGLGVGLTLAREVVERMGGRIFVQSEKGIGSEFGFSLPYRPAGSIKLKTHTEDYIVFRDWSTRKCLLVDDNMDMLLYIRRILHDTRIDIITARSGFEALQIIKFTPDIDLVLLDMQMPEMNGIEVTKEIRKIRQNLPIIAQTAFIFEDDKDIILEAGCDACIIKPIRREHLLSTMQAFLKADDSQVR